MLSSELLPLFWSFLGCVPYTEADELQRHLREQVRRRPDDSFLILLEHPHVFTLGRNADRGDILVGEDWVRARGAEIHASDRGGKVTYHGPGQLVGYPIVDLSPDRQDLRRYVRDLQQIVVRTLADLGVSATSRLTPTDEIGVWVGERKIASLGVHVSRWITTHGFALNLSTDLSYFTGIIPCGLEDVRMTSVEALTGQGPDLAEVSARIAQHFGRVFERRPERLEPGAIMDRWPIDS